MVDNSRAISRMTTSSRATSRMAAAYNNALSITAEKCNNNSAAACSSNSSTDSSSNNPADTTLSSRVFTRSNKGVIISNGDMEGRIISV